MLACLDSASAGLVPELAVALFAVPAGEFGMSECMLVEEAGPSEPSDR